MNLSNLSAYLWCINIGCLESPSNKTTNSKHKHNSDSPEAIETKNDNFRKKKKQKMILFLPVNIKVSHKFLMGHNKKGTLGRNGLN